MKYALLLYVAPEPGSEARRRDPELDEAVAAVLAQPAVTSWARLHDTPSATTVKHSAGGPLLTDGPFLDSKEFIAGLVMVESPDLDGALLVADELEQTRSNVTIEVRPVLQAS